MPFKSEKQRRYMWSEHPDIAQSWADEGKGYVESGKKDIKRKKRKGMGGSDTHLSGKR